MVPRACKHVGGSTEVSDEKGRQFWLPETLTVTRRVPGYRSVPGNSRQNTDTMANLEYRAAGYNCFGDIAT